MYKSSFPPTVRRLPLLGGTAIAWFLCLSPAQDRASAQQPASQPPARAPEAGSAPASPGAAPEPVRTSITVVEKLSTEAPASVEVLDPPRLQRIPGVNLDDRLRMVPGFSLFRRSSGLAAHPTTQGVSLRGIGSTGASRTLVLWDGVPLNDPFGGWVHWTRVAPEDLGRVEVSRGASTSVFGDRAMAGAVSLFTREPEPRRLTASYEFGNRNTNILSAGFSHVWSRWAVSANTRAFTTNGYYIVPAANRGPVDTEAAVRFVAPAARLDYLGSRDRLFLKMDLVVEDRKNGTRLQRNSTSLGNLAAHYARDWTRDGISVLAYHTRAEFRSSFSAIGAGRRTETLTSIQSVPADAAGGAAYWRHGGARWRGLIGADAVRVDGTSIDTFFPPVRRTGGGVVTQHGRFVQLDASAGPARFFLGARHSHTGQARQFFSPSAGLTAGRGAWRGRVSAYRSFRAPTLNELYRDFRQGNAVTQANDRLKPERLTGVEAGADYFGEAFRVSVTAFQNSLRDLVANVTLVATPQQIIRQRRNAGAGTAKGMEADFRYRWRGLATELSYLYSDSRFDTGFRTPQIPKHQGSAQLSWHVGQTWLAAGVRSTSYQFDDDINRFRLPGFAAVHLSVQRRLKRSLSAVVVYENLLNREYYTAFTPVPAIAGPRLWRAGLRWDGPLLRARR